MAIYIFTMTHKKFHPPADPIYVPLHVGHIHASDFGYLGDDTGDNISDRNDRYSELTGIYWIWKNFCTDDYVGICHYRRYLMNEQGGLFTEADYRRVLSEYDMITSKKLQYDYSYYDGYADAHNIHDLITTGKVITELCPEYAEDFQRMVHEKHAYFGNICAMSKQLFDEYAKWLFTILFEVEKRIDISTYDAYHKRVFGFLSEFLLLVWVTHKRLTVYESMVGMTEEKYETSVMKKKLAEYFSRKDLVQAKKYFCDSIRQRPDVLLEASDITGELRLAMQAISTCENEAAAGLPIFWEEHHEFSDVMRYLRRLNRMVMHGRDEELDEEDRLFLRTEKVTTEAVRIAVMLLGMDSCTEQKTFAKLLEITSLTNS